VGGREKALTLHLIGFVWKDYFLIPERETGGGGGELLIKHRKAWGEKEGEGQPLFVGEEFAGGGADIQEEDAQRGADKLVNLELVIGNGGGGEFVADAYTKKKKKEKIAGLRRVYLLMVGHQEEALGSLQTG